MASKSIKSAKRKADSLWSARIRKRNNGRCEICQKKANQPHHIIGRKNLSTRWDLRNGILLCYTHHVGGNESAHNDPMWFMDWFKKNRPEDYEYLQWKRRIICKRTLEDLEELVRGLE